MKCPNCGNPNPATIQDNGLRPDHPDLTLLCVNRVKPSESVFDQCEPELIGADGLTECGAQWEPNQD